MSSGSLPGLSNRHLPARRFAEGSSGEYRRRPYHRLVNCPVTLPRRRHHVHHAHVINITIRPPEHNTAAEKCTAVSPHATRRAQVRFTTIFR